MSKNTGCYACRFYESGGRSRIAIKHTCEDSENRINPIKKPHQRVMEIIKKQKLESDQIESTLTRDLDHKIIEIYRHEGREVSFMRMGQNIIVCTISIEDEKPVCEHAETADKAFYQCRLALAVPKLMKQIFKK